MGDQLDATNSDFIGNQLFLNIFQSDLLMMGVKTPETC